MLSWNSMINYKRLSDLEREEISRMLSQNCSLNDIAKQLGPYTSTISREIAKGDYNKYSYRVAKVQHRAQRNTGKRKTGKYRLNNEQALWTYISQKLFTNITGVKIFFRSSSESLGAKY